LPASLRSLLVAVGIPAEHVRVGGGEEGRGSTSDVCAGREEAALSGEDGEDGGGVLVEFSEGDDELLAEAVAKGVECFGAVQLFEFLIKCSGISM
jgi:hypothetical protein